MALRSKNTSLGLVYIEQLPSGWYGLYVGGTLKEQSPDLNYIMSAYDRIY